ncbi:CoA pyrophosphatase [Corynebacterium canis]|uniref:CoA pyrophosphatase n=1 Tax=Corynebacterium canis TaxID=679663 RepID=A0A5C5UI54_9CORY|nr:CoA pyrophosphatase [Corynebacterium canis]TWT25668.1 CoA pyrophosphatase [Corynebacterium canis]WJY74026.1 putative NUDIX hydrolase [Corynebacterium canis]
MNDIPGHNTELRPEKAPVWMRRLVDNVHSGSFHNSLSDRARMSNADRSRQAAVLMLFAGTETSATLPNDAAVLLTHRSPSLRSHSGQVAFPGGRLDIGDANPVDCALREAWEETGLDRRSVTPLAQLDEVHIRATGYPVHPVVSHWHTRTPVGVVRPEEADEVFDVPVLSLIDPANRFTVGWGTWTGPAFRINDYVIWGFTGGLLAAALHQAGWEEPWDRENVQNLRDTLAKSRNNERIV